MRVVEIDEFGGPDVVRIGDAPTPTPGPGQLLVRVAAAGINPVDWKVREGYLKDVMPFTFPTVLGNEFAGTVEALGAGVTDFKVGDEVHGATGMIGAFSEQLAVDAGKVAKKPANISMAEASALPIAVVTAVAALDAGGVGEGSKILIHAAAGGVGAIAVQLARVRGAEVTALASPANFDFVKGLGAAKVVDRTSDYWTSIGGFDMVLDAHGPEAQARSWGLLKPGGILVSLVAPPPEDVAAEHGVRGVMVFGAPNAATLSDVDKLVASGEVKVLVSRTYPVEEAKAALAESQGGQVRGKLVLTF
jgi:NADPH:quinone reductase-like Zn-dependent oxidoreductase